MQEDSKGKHVYQWCARGIWSMEEEGWGEGGILVVNGFRMLGKGQSEEDVPM